MDKDLLRNEKKHEFSKQAGKEKRALKSKMAGRGEKGWVSGMTQPFVIYTAGLCAWERRDVQWLVLAVEPGCLRLQPSFPTTDYVNLGKLLNFSVLSVLIWKSNS